MIVWAYELNGIKLKQRNQRKKRKKEIEKDRKRKEGKEAQVEGGRKEGRRESLREALELWLVAEADLKPCLCSAFGALQISLQSCIY